ncbi:glycosyltransferase family 39 protein [Cohnella sp. WQ 127256]|uniref:ArnT family glycosyltransferase n=1 Tax=Cohnella sp. WQ 127256 TaxID=2938790 RepID=UPI0021187D65|nr:glycosyltransferase family 39 protein [Cohnella sp. WQ 127256]
MKLLIKYQYVIIFIIGFVYSSLYYNYGINFIDEGFNLNSMKKISEGLVPFKDFFLLQTPGHLYLGSVLMSIFGKSILLMRIFTAITSSLFSLIVYYFLKRMTNTYFSLLGFMVSIIFGLSMTQISPSYSWNAVLLGIASVICMIKSIEKNNVKWMVLSGLLLCLVGLFKQTIGFYFLIGYCIAFVLFKYYKIDISKRYVVLISSAASLAIVFFIYLISKHTINDFFTDALILPLTDFKEAKLPPPTWVDLNTIFKDFKPWNFFAYLYFVQLIILIVSAVVVAKKIINKSFDFNFFIVFIFACTTFLHNYERASFLKVRTTFPMILILLIYLLYKLYKMKSTRLFSMVITGILLVVSVFGIESRFIVYKQYTELFPYKEKVYVTKEMSVKYNDLFNAVEKFIPKNEEVFIYPCNPMLYFVLDKQNPTRYSELMAGAINEDIINEIINDLKNVDYLIYDEHNYIDGKMFKDFAARLYEYISNDYVEVYKIDERTSILKRM